MMTVEEVKATVDSTEMNEQEAIAFLLQAYEHPKSDNLSDEVIALLPKSQQQSIRKARAKRARRTRRQAKQAAKEA